MTENLTQISRTERLKKAVLSAENSICTERALIWTKYFKNANNTKKPADIQIAEALSKVLLEKSVKIFPDEIIVGNFSSKRVGGSIYPELHGVAVLFDIFKFNKRKTNPLKISKKERNSLLKIIPFWSTRFLAIKAFDKFIDKIKFLKSQLKSTEYVINETAGIAHFAPDYEKLLKIGVKGILEETEKKLQLEEKNSDKRNFYEAVKIINKSLVKFAQRYSSQALLLAESEQNEQRKKDLLQIAEVCKNVPYNPAKNMHEALQSILFLQIALNLESLDNGISPGRIDYYLFDLYQNGLKNGTITREKAKELLAAFSIKFAELIPILSEQITEYHSGLMSGQVISVGGTNTDGSDSVNELTYILLELMDEIALRQPNFHARIHNNSPEKYLNKIFDVLASGNGSPALYNDEIITETMKLNGYNATDAQNYTPVGCVEPTVPGKTFGSTDAALFNVVKVLEKVIFSKKEYLTFELFLKAFENQLKSDIEKFVSVMHTIEKANHKYHPTPLSSSYIEGCLASGICSSGGGAVYNFSGVQCVGAADAGDSLYALKKAVFDDKKISLKILKKELKSNFKSEKIRKLLTQIPKFGNDNAEADKMTAFVAETFSKLLSKYTNYRGGKYVTGLYSMTTHAYFGKITGALPSGRKKGVSFSSGIAPANGADKNGPTAMFNSLNRIDFLKFSNGINLNVKLGKELMSGQTGKSAVKSLISTYFRRKGMQVQINVLDTDVLEKAQSDPNLYPHVLVRVSGYSAYFADLTREAQNEIIARNKIGRI